MGSILIAYASKSGTAQDAAERIARLLSDSDLVDLAATKPALENYQAAIIGGGVRMGSVHKDTKRFIDANAAQLASMKAAYFITNCFVDNADEILNKMLPEQLKNQAVFAGSLGGRMDINALKGLDKALAKMVSKALDEGQQVNNDIDEAALQDLVSRFVQA